MIVEGIVIHKTVYKEKDIICDLLLRSGKKLSLYIYGGKGGGKNQKGSIVEHGFMLKCTLNPRRKKIESELHIVKEYQLIWSPKFIRNDFKAFYLSTFFYEIVSKIAIEESLDFEDKEHQGLFNVLSNALFFLDHSLENHHFNNHAHLFLFLSKLTIQLGILPTLDECVLCDTKFKEFELCLFDAQSGGFVCTDCTSQKDEFLSDNKSLLAENQHSQQMRRLLTMIKNIQYKNYKDIGEVMAGANIGLFNYINYQFGFDQGDFKSWKLLL